MLDRLKDIERKFEDLTAQMGDPTVLADPAKFRDIAKQQSELAPVVAASRALQTAEQQLRDAEHLTSHGDADIRKMAQEEEAQLRTEVEKLRHQLKVLLLPRDPNDQKNIILEIRAGTGGEEAALFAAELFRMYARYAESKGWNVEILDRSETGLGGLKEIVAEISGNQVYSHLKFESGTHRVQRVPATEASGRVHTSAVTVAVLPEAEDVDVHIDEKDLRIDTYRAGGAGGQHVNRTDSAVRITHLPTNTVVTCQDERSQHKNKAKAMKVLRTRLLDIETKRVDSERREARRSQVGSGDRSEKIRTYNFPQNRLTDHRINFSSHNLPDLLAGNLDALIDALREQHQAELLATSAT